MAGHYKWSKVNRLKGSLNQMQGGLFSRLAEEITVAAKMGGSDPSDHSRQRSARTA